LHYISTVKPKTIKRKFATVKALFNFLAFEELIEINPFRKVKIRIKELMVLPRVMNIQGATNIFAIVYPEHDKCMIIMKVIRFSSKSTKTNIH